MKKHMIKVLAVLLCVTLLGSSLAGCSLLDKLDIPLLDKLLGKQEEATTGSVYVLTETTEFYAEPDWDAPVVAVLEAGVGVTYAAVVTIDECVWAQAPEGWFVIDGSKPVDILNAYDVYADGYALRDIITVDAPATFANQYSQVAAGALLDVFQIAETAEGVWANTDMGWIPVDSIYIPGQADQTYGYGVSRAAVSFYSVPGVQSNITNQLDSGARFQVYVQIEMGGYRWGHTDYGWVPMDLVYVEGTAGLRACTAMVIDTTPLNVRLGPGTDYEKLSKLHYGDYVEILEQVERDGKDWGYTGEGWIYTELTEIQ